MLGLGTEDSPTRDKSLEVGKTGEVVALPEAEIAELRLNIFEGPVWTEASSFDCDGVLPGVGRLSLNSRIPASEKD